MPVVFTPSDQYSEQLKKLGHLVITLKFISRKGKNPVLDFIFFLELLYHLKKNRIDLVLLYTIKPNIYGSLASKYLRIKSIATITGLGYGFLTKKYTGSLVKLMYKKALKHTDITVFHNGDDRNLFIKHNFVKKDKSLVIPGSGVDTKKYKPQISKKKDENVIRFLYFGRILYDKGVSELLEAFKMLSTKDKNTELILVGDIDKKNPAVFREKDFKERVDELENCQYFPGVDDVRTHIADTDVVVLPSYREGLPKTILEAMSMAKPIIVSNVPGCRDTIVQKEAVNGYFCNVKDAKSLFHQMLAMTNLSNEERNKMGKISRDFAISNFDGQIINKAYMELIVKLIKN